MAGFGSKATGDTTDNALAERLPKDVWSQCPEYEQVLEVTSTVGELKARLKLLAFKIKAADTKAKEEYPRKVAERFKVTETLEQEQAEIEAQLERALAAAKLLDIHLDTYRARLYAVGKIY